MNCGFIDIEISLIMLFYYCIFKIIRIVFLRFSFFSFFFFLRFCLSNNVIIIEWVFFSLVNLELSINLVFDKWGLLFRRVVIFITRNVIIFSHRYIYEEVYKVRFVWLIILFVLSINFLIYIPHLIGLLLGWDGLGLISFLLVIYYQSRKSLGAGIITALTNRLGDVFLLICIGWCLNQGHWIIFNIWRNYYILIIVFSIVLASFTKSAQIPFSRWLPAAIAAPTPVRALVHSSTLVTAGVFLLFRFYPFLSKVNLFNYIVLFISTCTMFIAGLSALYECDIKKIVALSTLSQLGVIMSSIGLGLPLLRYFHILSHALFKALLFVCVGTSIGLYHHTQDLRIIGNIVRQLPLTRSCIYVANIALCGIPFLAGFYSKDLIIEMTLYNSVNMLIVVMYVFATGITVMYRIRIMFVGVLRMRISYRVQYLRDKRSINYIPLLVLRGCGVVGGRFVNWIVLSPIEDPYLFRLYKLFPLILVLIRVIFMWLIIGISIIFILKNYYIKILGIRIWFIRVLSTQFILLVGIDRGKKKLIYVDQGWLEIFGSQGIRLFLSFIFKVLYRFEGIIIIIYLSLICIIIFIVLVYSSSLNKARHWSCRDNESSRIRKFV